VRRRSIFRLDARTCADTAAPAQDVASGPAVVLADTQNTFTAMTLTNTAPDIPRFTLETLVQPASPHTLAGIIMLNPTVRRAGSRAVVADGGCAQTWAWYVWAVDAAAGMLVLLAGGAAHTHGTPKELLRAPLPPSSGDDSAYWLRLGKKENDIELYTRAYGECVASPLMWTLCKT
jgi:hypothetical protein